MGETGVGKTSLVNYLADVMEALYLKLFLHAGVEEKEIFAFMYQAIKEAKYSPQRLVIIFLDEINTNEHISGVLKEIIVDQCIQGQSLPTNISIVAACNPYKFKTAQQMRGSSCGLSFQNEL